MFVKSLDGREQALVNQRSPSYPEDWSTDGKWIVYTDNSRATGTDLWIVPLAGDRILVHAEQVCELRDAE